jgi:hypothetical protein
MYHPGGAIWAFGGAVTCFFISLSLYSQEIETHTLQLVPVQVTAGNNVRCPILFPCVELTLPNKLTFTPPTELVKLTVAP